MVETTGNRMMTMRTTDKPFNVTKKQVYEAYKAVKSNQGAAGVDQESIEQIEANQRFGHARLTIDGLDDRVAGAGEQSAQHAAEVLLVLNHKDALTHVALFRNSARVGSSIWKVDPLPSVDSTQMRPPCISTICLAMASPRPVPPLALVFELSQLRPFASARPRRQRGPNSDRAARCSRDRILGYRRIFGPEGCRYHDVRGREYDI
jgi:hypothetical protein